MPQEFASIPYNGPAAARYGNYNKRYMVIHCTSNTASPWNETEYAKRRDDGVGLHFCSDPNTVLQGLESWYGTGHVGSALGNQYGISWEFVGHTSWSTDYWKSCIDRAVDSMRLPMQKHGIPYRWLTDSELRGGSAQGLVTHQQFCKVIGGCDHTDPGPNFPKQYLIDALEGNVAEDISANETPNAWTQAVRVDGLFSMYPEVTVDWGTGPQRQPNKLAETLNAILAKPGAEVDEAALAAALASNATFVETLADAVAEKLRPIIFEEVQRAEDE